MSTANFLTIFRILLVPVFAVFLYMGTPETRLIALSIFLIAGITDAIDGWIARKRNQVSKFGKHVDPIADKILLITAFIMLTLDKSIPVFLTVIVIARDIVIISGFFILCVVLGSLEPKPSKISKCTTFLQIFTIVYALLNIRVPSMVFIVWTTIGFTAISGINYIIYGAKLLNGNKKA
ncbi:CDP-alcohol phosphatidyltransferase family protein [bacterium]|nr:CDP-alcohol phosphatidyltransferase family protein [bacterium]